MPTCPEPNFTSLLTCLPNLARTGTHHLLRACQNLKRDWLSLSHTQRVRALRLAVQRYGPRGARFLRAKQKAVASGMCLLQLWMYRGVRVGRRGRKVGAGRGKAKGSRAVSTVGSEKAPRVAREVRGEELVPRDGIIEAATRDAGTQTYEAPTPSTRPPTAALAVAAASAKLTTTTTTTDASSSTTPTRTPSILHHQLAHLHAEFSALQHAFFAMQASNTSLHNYVLDQQIRNRILLHELRAENNRRLEIANGKKCEGLEGEIAQLRTENGRLRGFLERLRDEAGGLLGVGG
ncbi:hypothetical protein KC360_g8945 [Hortaea werneckii]|nr:hypothetical protein KC359_g9081 [Hortaea werneckii]KAI7166930.1 hypothetical protein KC360_g8945 [Hortaea werneckii]